MPGCVNGMCRKEFVNGIEVEIAQTCECERFPATHVLTDSTYKYTGPRCDQRKLDILNKMSLEYFFIKQSSNILSFLFKLCTILAVCVPSCENGGMCVMAGDTNTTITASGHSDAGTCA